MKGLCSVSRLSSASGKASRLQNLRTCGRAKNRIKEGEGKESGGGRWWRGEKREASDEIESAGEGRAEEKGKGGIIKRRK